MEACLHAMPPDMVSMLDTKDILNTIKTTRLSVMYIREAKKTVLRKQLETIKFLLGESIDD
jgi:hypothetical protein